MGISRNFQGNYAIFNTIDSLLFGGRLRGAGDVFFTRIRIDEHDRLIIRVDTFFHYKTSCEVNVESQNLVVFREFGKRGLHF
jgi:hypothetical protein